MQTHMKNRKPVRLALTAGLGLSLGMLLSGAAFAASSGPAEPTAQSAPDMPTGGSHSWVFLAGTVFHPFGDGAQFTYNNGGCVSRTGGTENRLTHKVLLPRDAVIRYVRLFYYDASPSAVTAYLTSYDAAGHYSYIDTVGSSDAGGYGDTLGPYLSHTVDPYLEPISMTINLGSDTTPNLRFCGVRIAYESPQSDVIFQNGFDFL